MRQKYIVPITYVNMYFSQLGLITEMGQDEMTRYLPEEGVLGYFLILLLLRPLIALLPLMFPLFLLEFLGALVFLDSPRGNIVCMSSMAISESMASLNKQYQTLRQEKQFQGVCQVRQPGE